MQSSTFGFHVALSYLFADEHSNIHGRRKKRQNFNTKGQAVDCRGTNTSRLFLRFRSKRSQLLGLVKLTTHKLQMRNLCKQEKSDHNDGKYIDIHIHIFPHQGSPFQAYKQNISGK